MIHITIEDKTGGVFPIEIPEDISLSLMEVLKASGFDIAATCGGMALCATCHVAVLKGAEKLSPQGDAEMDMIDTLPNASNNSRLACQLRITDEMEGMHFKIKGEQ